jgi:hypothetical protein
VYLACSHRRLNYLAFKYLDYNRMKIIPAYREFGIYLFYFTVKLDS